MKKKGDSLSRHIRERGLNISVTLMSEIVGCSRNTLYYMYENDFKRLEELVDIAKEKIDSICIGVV